MNTIIKKLFECRQRVKKEINRPLTMEEDNIVRISFLYGRGTIYDEQLEEIAAKEAVNEVWADLGTVIVNEDDCIELEWRHFPPGTEKLEIWHWIEDTYNVSIAEDLMNSITG